MANKLEKATLDRHFAAHSDGPLTPFEASWRLLTAGAFPCACGAQATGLHTVNGRTVRSCRLCRQLARQRRFVTRFK